MEFPVLLRNLLMNLPGLDLRQRPRSFGIGAARMRSRFSTFMSFEPAF
jgi:hypothetical protein